MNMTAGHKFTWKKSGTGEPVCTPCGLVWRSAAHHPPITCPGIPLGIISPEWAERYT